MRTSKYAQLVRLAVAYDDATEDETPPTDTDTEGVFTIPESFEELSNEQLGELHAEAINYFDTLYGDGSNLSDEDLETLAQLTEGIESIQAEATHRSEADEERSARAAELAARVNPEQHSAETDQDDDSSDEDDSDGEADGEEADDQEEETDDESAAETVTASGRRKPISLNLSSIRRPHNSRTVQNNFNSSPGSMRDVVVSGEDAEGMDWADMSQQVDRRLASFNSSQYNMAAKRGTHLREQHSLAVFKKPFREDQIVKNGDLEHIESIMASAVNESNLPQGSLVASGGWCAPSEVLYDFLELESRDGLLSVPEIGITRGGIQFTQGPLFSDIYNATGFSFTEQEDIDGEYSDPNGEFEGNKPYYKIECPEFQETRLDVDGLYITAGLLQQRGFPEIIARTLRGALVAHDHKMSSKAIGLMAAGSTEVVMPSEQVGAVAPVLNTIELQTMHYRYTHRLPLNATLEGIFPAWTYGPIKADLARRDGLDVLAVTDAQISAWFAQRGIAPQFVYDWQALDTTDPASFTAWPTELQFLLYAAGTWVRGTSDIITLDTVYDSVNLGQNDYIALFTEEGSLMAKRGHDSRLVTVGIDASGSIGARQLIEHNGTAAPLPEAPEAPAGE